MEDSIQEFMTWVVHENPGEVEFHQAVREVAETLIPFIEEVPRYRKANLMKRLVEPERVVIFRVPWVDDQGEIQVNRGYRVQMNSAIGPYKGGLRFHPTVNLGTLKFLAFEQVFKNSLTQLPMGGGKGGSNFDPKGKSDGEVMRFCQSFMTELFRHISHDADVPAGDIGVGQREIGYLFGQYKRLKNEYTGVLTGKGHEWGGSLIRPEATGYGVVYFVDRMLAERNDSLKGKRVVISGAGNVAQYTVEKCIEMGAKVLTLSDSSGYIYDENGIDAEKLAYILELKNVKRERIKVYADRFGCTYVEGKKPWEVPCDVAFADATQNELDENDAAMLIKNGCFCVAEGANMPSTPEAIELFRKNDILFAPGKASNAGGVAVSGLEMSQNSLRLSWTREEVDQRLFRIMENIHMICKRYGRLPDGRVDYVKGANIGGFVRVAEAMIAQGVV